MMGRVSLGFPLAAHGQGESGYSPSLFSRAQVFSPELGARHLTCRTIPTMSAGLLLFMSAILL
jgi:hypothetical protein